MANTVNRERAKRLNQLNDRLAAWVIEAEKNRHGLKHHARVMITRLKNQIAVLSNDSK